MSRLSPYVNEIISFIVMLLMLVALVSGQMNEQAYKTGLPGRGRSRGRPH